MTAVPAPASVPRPGRAADAGRGAHETADPEGDGTVDAEFDLVESAAGWQLTITLTDRLREALAGRPQDPSLRVAVRIAPNLVPGDPFETRVRVRDARTDRSG